MESKLGFEIETCSRCGGTGHYSYNQMDGTRCFKCHGKKVVYTKRGRAAFDLYEAQFRKPLGEFRVGDLMRCEELTNNGMAAYRFFAPVVEVSEEKVYAFKLNPATGKCDIPVLGISVVCEHPKRGRNGMTGPTSMMVRFGASAEQKAAALEKALAYQASLTKAGKPMKIKKEASNV